jgi:hypothetical protein
VARRRRLLAPGRASGTGRSIVGLPAPPPPSARQSSPAVTHAQAASHIPFAALDAFIALAATGGFVPPPLSGDAVIQLYSTTLAAPAASIDTGANGVPSGSTHLLIVLALATDRAGQANDLVAFQANADTGANYAYLGLGFDATGGGSQTSGRCAWCAGNTSPAGVYGASLFLIPYYTASIRKEALGMYASTADNAAANAVRGMYTVSWQSTAAITRLAFISGTAANFRTGSRVTIYGM